MIEEEITTEQEKYIKFLATMKGIETKLQFRLNCRWGAPESCSNQSSNYFMISKYYKNIEVRLVVNPCTIHIAEYLQSEHWEEL